MSSEVYEVRVSMRLRSVCLILLLLSSLACAGSRPALHVRPSIDGIDAYLQGEQLHLQDGAPQAIIRALNKAIAQYPGVATLYYHRAVQYKRVGEVRRARDDVLRAMTLAPENVEFALHYIRLLMREDAYVEALQHLQQLRQRLPHDARSYLLEARIYASQEAYGSAERVLRQLARVSEHRLKAYYALGQLYEKEMQQPRRAQQMYRQALTIDADHPDVLFALVQLQLDQHHHRQALRLFLRLERIFPDDATIKVRMAILYAELEAYDEAIHRLRRMIVRHPQAYRLHYYLAAIYVEAGQLEAAMTSYLAIPPTSGYFRDARISVATYYANIGQYARAIAVVQEAMRMKKKELPFYEYLAFLYQEQKAYPLAAKTLQQAIRQFPKETGLHYALGLLYDRMAQPRAAVRMLRKVLQRQPDNVYALNYIGYMYVEWGRRLDEAEAMLQKAAGMRPNDGHIIDSLGWLYFRQGDYVQALLLLERANELLPQESVIWRHLAETYLQLGRIAEARAAIQRADEFHEQQKTPDAAEAKEIERVQGEIR